ncbi:YbfB/YjiJ family MFS transporter [Cumulibacter soli]|uniref:YbfB/YjiJ family MFS transporter n=1 Tax=Cumulibacter soli TaxID=2546344 RepID=UPI001ABB5795|nr:YbfB/YjiJ family MFS transporter [Cumulibacter soli]
MNYRSPWPIILQVAAALAMAMGIGRFVYTPILPLMTESAGLSASGSALLATMNYIGYFLGAAAGIVWPRILHSALIMKVCLAVSVVAIAMMAIPGSIVLWSALRLVSGIASAIIFMAAVAGLNRFLGAARGHLSGWAMAGVGVGIAVSGALVLVVRSIGTWQTAWLTTGALAALLAAVAWRFVPEQPPQPATAGATEPRKRATASFSILTVSYTLEGVGYIIAGTFLVAAIDATAAAWVGSSAWILVGLASSVSVVIWLSLTRRFSRTTLMAAALTLQLVGVSLPAMTENAGAALVAAVLFGGTFVPIAILALSIGPDLPFPRAVPILTTAYSVGQILGPLVVAPLLRDGYHVALWVGAGCVLASLVFALVLRVRVPNPRTA